MNPLKPEQLDHLVKTLGKSHPLFNQLIPDFTTRKAGVLEGCIGEAGRATRGRAVYPTVISKAGILFYLINKKAPLKKGNKRLALAVLLYFLSVHQKWLNVDADKLYQFAVWVAESPDDAKEELLIYIEKFLKKHVVKYGG